ncbi:conserved hypothetical protein [Verticillium alfalfae VaMs.102]|uniref:Ankyrin repeat protein n=1 Tax=Verticillium alfalfae (strain VaMs.102 / ATCC MYA-4576 / FGSC 10136) TaxID=526221 RepID=C9S9N3_VERA1|nr:conserved hypothetical protein [Verticillium alfalfae VaMs.102]EEY16096.1 conserved hypothetical protein [Verticillium alfalfae VaMs.102]
MFILAAYPTLLAILIGTATVFHFTHTGNQFTHTPGRRCRPQRRCAYCTRVLVARQFMQSTHIDSLFQGTLGLGMSEASYENELAPVPGHPEAIDVVVVKALLIKATNFPPEIIDMIIDHAEYWPCSETVMDYTGQNKVRISAGHASHTLEDRLLLRTPPVGFASSAIADADTWGRQPAPALPLAHEASPQQLKKIVKTAPALTHPVRKVVFKLRSSDQGWGGERENHGTFHGSWTWFEAGLEKIEAEEGEQLGAFRTDHLRPLYPRTEEDHREWGNETRKYVHQLNANEEYKIQCNRTCTRGVSNYEITWRWTDAIDPESTAADELEAQGRGRATGNGEFVRNLQLGDVITVWGKSRFPGWANNVETVAVEVYWAI